MASLAGTQNALDRDLAELEKFGLGRPANALFSEYLSALVIERVIDDATARSIGAVYNRSRYGAVDPGDADFIEAVSALDRVTASIAAMPAEERLGLSTRFRNRFEPALAGEGHQKADAGDPPIVTPRSLFRRPTVSPDEEGRNPAPELSEADDFSAEPATGKSARKPRRRWSLGKVSIEMAIVAAMVLFGGGYVARNLMDKKLPVRTPELADLLYQSAKDETAKNDQRARMAYELLLTYPLKRETVAGALNNLAWLYLTTQDANIHDSKHGFELALKAVAISPKPEYLDTAAEGYFQMGQADKAVSIEEQALARLRNVLATWPVPFQREAPQILGVYETQLHKFKAAAKSTPANPPKKALPPSQRASKLPRAG